MGGMSPVKDFFRDVWRIAAACAAGAFVFSLLVGLIAANPFGIAFSRAFLLALLFAGLGVGLRAVVKAYLPEVMGAARPAADSEAPAEAGTVDIVLPEDETLQREVFQGPLGAPGRAESEGAEEEPAEVLDAADGEEPSAAEARAIGELAEQLGDELAPAEEVQPEDELPRSVSDTDAGALDALPDMAGLEPPPGHRNGPAARVPRAGGRTPEDAVRNLLANEDPATLARAIRTSLKKDEKG